MEWDTYLQLIAAGWDRTVALRLAIYAYECQPAWYP
jgi:hypothetical protein